MNLWWVDWTVPYSPDVRPGGWGWRWPEASDRGGTSVCGGCGTGSREWTRWLGSCWFPWVEFSRYIRFWFRNRWPAGGIFQVGRCILWRRLHLHTKFLFQINISNESNILALNYKDVLNFFFVFITLFYSWRLKSETSYISL